MPGISNIEVFEKEVLRNTFETFLSVESDMLKLCTPNFDLANTVVDRDREGAATFSPQSGATDADTTEVRAFSSRSAPTTYEARIDLTNEELRTILAGGGFDAAVDFGTLLAQNAMAEIADDFFSVYALGRTTAHPDFGVSGTPYAAVGGGTFYFVDNFDMSYLDGTTGTQTNDHTLAYNSANQSTLLAKRRTYKNRTGKPRLPQALPFLMVGAANEGLARALAAQEGRFYTGAAAELGFAGQIADIIVPPAGIWDPTAWGLVWCTQKDNPAGGSMVMGPVRSHVRLVPTIRVTDAPKGNYKSIVAEFEYDNYLAPFEGNFLFSKP